MSLLGELIVALRGDITGFQKSMQMAARDMRATERTFNDLGNKLTLGVTVPLAGLGAVALKVAGDLEQNKVAFTTMLGSAEAAGRHLEALKKFALSTPFEFTDLTVASKRLQALGFSASEVIPTLTAVGNATAALGSGAEGINRITTALGQMQAKGKVQAEEMRQLAEAGIPAWQILAKTLNTDVAGAMKLVEARAVDSATAIPALLSGMNQKFGGLMAQQSQTLLGQWSNFKDSATFTLAEIGKILTPLAKQVLELGQSALRTGKEWTQAFVNQPKIFQEMQLLAVLLLAGLGPLAKGIGLVSGAMASLTTASIGAASKFGLVGAAVVAQIGLWSLWGNEVRKSLSRMGEAIDYLRGSYQSIIGDAKTMASTIGNTAIDREKERAIKAGAKAYEEFKKATDDAASAQAEFAKRAQEESARVAREYKTLVDGWKEVEQALASRKATQALESQLIDMLNRAESWREGMAQLAVLDPPKFKSIQPILTQIDQIQSAAKTLQMSLDEIQAPDINIYRNADKTNTEALEDVLGKIDAITKASGKATAELGEMAKEMDREVRRAFDSMARNMAKSIVDWKGWGATIKAIGKDFAQGMLEIFLQELLKPVKEKVAAELVKVFKNGFKDIIGGLKDLLSGIGSALKNVFGGASAGAGLVGGQVMGDVLGGSSGAIGSVLSSGAGAASTAGSAASSGASAALGWANFAATIGMGIVQMISGRAQGMDIQRTEENTRWCKIDLHELRGELLNKWMPMLSTFWQWWDPCLQELPKIRIDMNQRAYDIMRYIASGSGGKGGSSTVTIHINGGNFSSKAETDATMNQVVYRLRMAGVAV